MTTDAHEGPLHFDLPMNVTDIEKCLPHRYPFLLIDQIVAFEKGEFIRGRKYISANEPFLQGHFPGMPVMPGVLMVESIAQASAVLGKLTLEGGCSECLLMEIKQTRFRRVAVPGEVLDIEVKVTNNRKNFFWFEGTAKVEGQMVVDALFSAKLS